MTRPKQEMGSTGLLWRSAKRRFLTAKKVKANAIGVPLGKFKSCSAVVVVEKLLLVIKSVKFPSLAKS